MKKLILLLPLLLSFIFCQSQLRFKIIKKGTCLIYSGTVFSKSDIRSPEDFKGEVIFYPDNRVEVYTDLHRAVYENEDPEHKLVLGELIDEKKNIYSEWKAKEIITSTYSNEEVLIRLDYCARGSECTFYISFYGNPTGNYYICLREF